MAATLRSTILKQAANDAWRVEVAIADNDDIELAQESVSLVVTVDGLGADPHLKELSQAALRRTSAIIDECIKSLAESR